MQTIEEQAARKDMERLADLERAKKIGPRQAKQLAAYRERFAVPRALIGPSGHGSFGIVWRDAPVLEGRGGYSGPFNTPRDAEMRAVDLALFHEGKAPIIERVENINRIKEGR